MRRPQYVLAVDPGGTTGFASWVEGSDTPVQWHEDDQLAACDRVRTMLGAGVTAMVCESFQLAGKNAKSTGGSLQAIEIIGACRMLAADFGVPFVLQSPSDAASFVTNEKLRRLGWWAVGQEHARSATKHLVLYMTRSGLLDPARLA